MASEIHNPFYAQPSTFWDQYLKFRPQVPQSFLEKIFSIHSQHGGNFGIAHEVGAGVGVFSQRLAQKFSRVIVSDISASVIEAAKQRLGEDNSLYNFRPGEAAESIQGLDEGGVDMVFAANCLHFCQDDEILTTALAHQLAPGTGTLIIGAWGKPVFEDTGIHALWQDIMDRAVKMMLDRSGSEEARAKTIQTLRRLESGYDCIRFRDEFWEAGVKRVRLNWPDETDLYKRFAGESIRTETFRIVPPEYADVGILESQASREDSIEDWGRDAEWDIEWDVEGMRSCFGSYDFADAELFREEWNKIDALMSVGKKTKGTFPVALVVAHRKSDTVAAETVEHPESAD